MHVGISRGALWGINMPSVAKKLIELAGIDLEYARLEIAYADQPSRLLDRIGYHLNELNRYMSELSQSIDDLESVNEKTHTDVTREI